MDDARSFRIVYLRNGTSCTEHREQPYRKDHDTDTALPLHNATPEKNASGQRLHLGEYRGSCGREAGHGLEESIRHGGSISAEDKRKHADKR